MVSMKDISKRCNVSVATVSKALNDHSDISVSTKEYIKSIAKEMGYFPNSSARALKTNKTFNIGVLFADEAGSGLKHDYFASVLDSFKVAAESHGYDLTFINCNRSHKNMSFLEHSRYRGVDGVIVACVNFDDTEVIELIQSDLPVVTIDHSFNDHISIESDNIKGMHDIISYLNSMGHRNIAYIHGADSAVTRKRLSSFYHSMEELGLPVNEDYIKDGIYRDHISAAKYTRELLKLKNPPTAILYPDDYSCIGGINAIKEMGLSIPDDISVVGYDGISISKILEPAITTIEQDTSTMGQQAAKCLISLIEHPKSTIIQNISIEGHLRTGGSVKDLKNI